MVRWYILLFPFCLILQDKPNFREQTSSGENAPAVPVVHEVTPLKDEDRLRQDLLAGMAFITPQPFPGTIPWEPMHEIGTKGLYPLDCVLHYHPLLFLEMCLDRYKAEVKGYSTTFIKRERIEGKLQPPEKIEVHFREQPFSVSMNWQEGARLAQKVLYVAGENNGKLLARGRGLILASMGVFEKDVDSADAKKTGRYPIDQFGIYLGTKRSLESMRKARKEGTLHIEYQGIFRVPELGDRVCHKFVRTPYAPPEDDGVFEYTIYIDQENWLQIGSVLKDVEGNLIASYFFRDLKINPQF